MRDTKQKEIILKIVNNSYSHPTALEIYKEAKKELPKISLGTVYRNLNKLVEQNKIKKLQNDIHRFDKVEKKHSHFICSKCKEIIDIYEPYLENKKNIEGNIVMDYEINFKGICKNCLEKEN